jgi:hypothetical protein
MSEHVYSGSVPWALIEMASGVAYWVVPVLFLIACAVLTVRHRCTWSAIALLGSVLSVGERVTRALSDGIHWIYLGGRQPTEDQNAFEMFFFLHGGNLGYLLVSVGLLGYFLRRYSGTGPH